MDCCCSLLLQSTEQGCDTSRQTDRQTQWLLPWDGWDIVLWFHCLRGWVTASYRQCQSPSSCVISTSILTDVSCATVTHITVLVFTCLVAIHIMCYGSVISKHYSTSSMTSHDCKCSGHCISLTTLQTTPSLPSCWTNFQFYWPSTSESRSNVFKVYCNRSVLSKETNSKCAKKCKLLFSCKLNWEHDATDLLHSVLIAADEVLNATVTYEGRATTVTRGRPLCSVNTAVSVTVTML